MTLDEFLSCKLLVQAIRGGGTIKYKKIQHKHMHVSGASSSYYLLLRKPNICTILKIIKYGGGVIIIYNIHNVILQLK